MQKSSLNDWLDILDGNFGVGIVGGAHFYFDEDVGGGAFLVEPAFEAGEGTTDDADFLVEVKVIGSEEDGIARLFEHILKLTHLIFGDEGEGLAAITVGSACLVELKTVEGGVFEENAHQLVYLRMDEHAAGKQELLYLAAVTTLVGMDFALACHVGFVACILEHGAEGALAGSLAFAYVPTGVSYGKARVLMHVCGTLDGCVGYVCSMRHVVRLSG